MRLAALCAVLAAGCTTDFSKEDTSADDASDTGGDTHTDGPGDAPGDAPGDVPGDVLPDGPLPEVNCRQIRDVANVFPTTTHIPFGCDPSSGDCMATAIWIMEQGANLIVIHGSEGVVVDPGARLIANMLGVGDLRIRSQMIIHDSAPYDTNIRGGSLVERTEDWDVLLVSAVDEDATGGPSWNIRRVAVTITGSDTMDYDEDVLLEPGVPQSMGALLNPRGVYMRDSSSLHVLVQLTDWTGWETNQLFGATLTRDVFDGGGIAFSDEFHPMQPDMTGTFYVGRPDVSEGTLVIPFMEIVRTPASIGSGLWVHHGAITPGSTMGKLVFEGTRSTTASVAGTFRAPGTYAATAVTTNSEYVPETPLAPPYQLDSAVIVGDEIDGTSITGRDVFEEINYSGTGDFLTWDVTDTVVLHDPTTGFHYYIHPFYDEFGNAMVGIFPLREDGTAGGEPLFVSTGQHVMPAFDATINPETGAIYLARHMETGTVLTADIPGFAVTEISCPIIE
ncbi:MAG: hypothetical protein JRG91_13990 [Deltaproteobacteria bacterium]|nr:hypothetical protein [Deltaproteobacteria bacterium]